MKNQNTSKKTGLSPAGSYEKPTLGTPTATRTPGRRGRKPKQAAKDDFSDLNFTWEGDAYEAESAWDDYGSKPAAYGRTDDEDSDESYTNSYGRRRHSSDDDGYDSDSYESFRRG